MLLDITIQWSNVTSLLLIFINVKLRDVTLSHSSSLPNYDKHINIIVTILLLYYSIEVVKNVLLVLTYITNSG